MLSEPGKGTIKLMQKYLAVTYKLLQKEWFIILLLCVLTIPAFGTLFFRGYFPHHDDLQVMRLYEMQKCFADGQIPCRWIPDMGWGYGYPLFNFYPPLPYLFGLLVKTIFHIQFITTVKVLFVAQILASAIFMYLFAKQWWGRTGGFVSALFYTYAPYHAVDLYVRGAVNEAWAMAAAPAIGWAMTRLAKSISISNSIVLGLAIAALLLSHNPMTIIFAPFLAVFGVLLVVTSRSLRLLGAFLLAGVIAIGLAAFFSLPVAAEQKYVHIESLFGGYFDYTQHFVTVKQLFISRYWGYGGSTYGPDDHMAFPLGLLHWIGTALATFIGVWFVYRRKYKLAGIVSIFAFYFWLTAFLMHERSTFIWHAVVPLHVLQFPWRLLSTTTFCSSFLAGLFVYIIKRTDYKVAGTILLGILVLLINIQFFVVEYHILITDHQKLSGQLLEDQRKAGIFDYLPIYAVAPPGTSAPGMYQIMADGAIIEQTKQGTNWAEVKAHAMEPYVLRFNIMDFPNWQVKVDNKVVQHNHENYLGLITATIPAGKHTVRAELVNTPIRVIGNTLTISTIIGIIGWYLYVFVRKYKEDNTDGTK